MKKKIVILASGNGTNAERIISYFRQAGMAEVSLLITNNPQAGVLSRCKRLGIPTMIATRNDFYVNELVKDKIKTEQPDLIVLAGFLWLLPTPIIQEFPNKIINIHPALLPAYGGKGMYGHHVHDAVIAARETKSGITIHYVNDKYDDGNIIFQKETLLTPKDTANTLAEKIHLLEQEFFPKIIEELLA